MRCSRLTRQSFRRVTRQGSWLLSVAAPPMTVVGRCCSSMSGNTPSASPSLSMGKTGASGTIAPKSATLNDLSCEVRAALSRARATASTPLAEVVRILLRPELRRAWGQTDDVRGEAQRQRESQWRKALLHPLLALHVLQALSQHSTADTTSPSPLEWVPLYAPLLTSMGNDGAAVGGVGAQFLVMEMLLVPLLPLLGDPLQGRPGHGQVRLALHNIFTWLCAMLASGYASSRLPLESWMPVMAHEYSLREQTTQREDVVGGMAMPKLPSLKAVMLPALPTLWTAVRDGRVAPPLLKTSIPLLMASLHEELASSVVEAYGCDHQTPGRHYLHPQLAEGLFWHQDGPLAADPAVRSLLEHMMEHVTRRGGKTALRSRVVVLPLPVEDDDCWRRLLLRLTAASVVAGHSTNGSLQVLVEPFLPQGAETETMVLRYILPLEEFIQSVANTPQEGGGQTPLAMSFAGLRNVLVGCTNHLQRLRSESCGGSAGTGSYALLPHKPRLHALKRVCERLLHNSRHVLKAEEDAAHEPTSSPTPRLLFPDTPAASQVAVFRQLCGASRALVRTVMEEKRWSLLREGPEGAALVSGGATRLKESSIADILRNTAFRVVEPALQRYYLGTDHVPLLRVFTMEELRQVMEARPERLTSWRVRHYAEAVGPAWSAVDDLFQQVGESSSLHTAYHLLRQPSSHPVSAVVEAIRLYGVHALLLSASTMMMIDEERLPPGALELTQAMFCVWHHSRTVTTAEESASEEAVCDRLLLIVLLCCQRFLAHQPLSLIGPCVLPLVDATAQQPLLAALRSLYALLTENGEVSEWQRLGPAVESVVAGIRNVEDGNDESAVCHAGFLLPPVGQPAGHSAKWTLVEELRQLCAGQTPMACTTWQWLGSASAIRQLLTSLESASSPDVRVYALLPWSTLAHSTHPFCVYDEGGRSGDHLQSLLQTLQQLQTYTAVEGQHSLHPRLVLRVVGLYEEFLFFAEASRHPITELAPGIQVVHGELSEELEVATLWRKDTARHRMEGEDDDDEFHDGLD